VNGDQDRDLLGYTLEDYEQFAAESRAAQGLPAKITDPVVLDGIAALIRAGGGAA
jgi:hypothetical protein